MNWLKKNLYWFYPAVLTIIAAVPLIIWLKIDTNLPHWDMGRHLYLTMVQKDLWTEFFYGQRSFLSVIGFYSYYPPVVHLLALPFYWIFGISQDSAVYSNIVWMFILLFSVFNISKKLIGTKAGIASVLVILSSPIIIGMMREFQIDLPLTSIFALSLYLFLKTEKLTNRKYVILSGVVAGIGMMLKWTYLAYAGPAGGILLILGLMEKDKRKQVLKNLLIAFLIALAICGYWYIKNFWLIGRDFATNGIGVAKLEGDPTGLTPEALSWYFKNINRYYLYLPMALLFAVSLIVSAISKTYKKNGLVVILLLIYYCIFSILPNKDIRYIMPSMVLIVVITSSLFEVSRSKIVQTLMFSILILILLLNNASVAFGKYWGMEDKILFHNTSYSYYGILVSDIGGYTSGSPRQEICPIEEIVGQIPSARKARVMGEDNINANDWAVGFLLVKDDKYFSRDIPFQESDYIIYKEDLARQLSYDSWYLKDATKLINTYECSDNSRIYLTKVNK